MRTRSEEVVLADLNDYWLRRWSLLVLLRDDFTCYVCGEKLNRKDGSAHAHHVYPKAVYLEKAYELDNGVCACAKHHLGVVHADWYSWKKWTGFFRRWIRRVKQRRFNEEHQHKVRRTR